MDFELTELQVAIRDLADKVLASRAPTPGSMGGEWPDRALLADLGSTGLLACGVSPEAGGQGGGMVEVCLVLEAAGRAAARAPIMQSMLAAAAVDRYAGSHINSERLQSWLAGQRIVTVCVGDGHGGDGPTGLAAARRGNDWVLDGALSFVPFGAEAEDVLAFAETEGGGLLFVMSPRAAGCTVQPLATTSGAPEARLEVRDMVVPHTDVVIAGAGAPDARAWLWERVLVGGAATLVGLGDAALRLTASYTSQRLQFGRPLSSFQAVAMHAADAFIDVEGAKLATLQAAWRQGAGLTAQREASIAKFWASEAITRVLAVANHLHGGMGLLLDYPLARYMTAARHQAIANGASQWHLARLGSLLAVRARADTNALLDA
ncbi:MAG: acyl-CoA/acyl-ACP dehydrogenase [Phenylobacterium sp.]|uniref:acyl-CoA dehydrogenase family protein n=2 Tax=unclassified Phenylobacterium TaxID=2640670 RepID=UPI001A2CF3AC|nr:acyl-CoA dehydrogenase family protein [Phenylobacterium sp.]MBJ7412061.1 acyl-CoA/acyl-ACP dehydrogenase [Phenylobacterium sp.]